MTNHARRAQRKKQRQAQFRHHQRDLVVGAPLAASALVLALGASAQATPFTVTDPVDGAEGSLRHAIAAANINPGPDTINFNLSTPVTIDLTLGQLTITDAVTITGPGANLLTISGGGASRIFLIDGPEGGGMEVTLSGMTLTNGVATGGPGGFGAASVGGAIYSYGANLNIMATTISGNVAGNTGMANDVGGFGGGIASVSGDLTVTNSTISGNVAGNTGTANSVRGYGGGIVQAGVGNVTITNSTISGNVAGNTGTATTNVFSAGGGILSFFSGGNILLESSTIANNTASIDGGEGGLGGGIVISPFSGPTTLHNTIVAGNTGAPGLVDLLSYSGPFLTTYSLIQNPGAVSLDDSAAPGSNVLNQDPLLGPLQNNGGPTKTQTLLPGSPAINQGDPNNFQPTDQRGVARPIGSAPDIGAVEVGFNFSGFFQPVANLPTVNQVNGGQSIPVKFSIGGNLGLNILAAGSPTSQPVSCTTHAPIGGSAPTATAGGSGLTYDATANQYTYVWKTQKAWAGTCRQLDVTLADGTVHSALFKFK